jgi:hypothetical protein
MKNKPLIVLSLFDGMSCGQIALERAWHTSLKPFPHFPKYVLPNRKQNIAMLSKSALNSSENDKKTADFYITTAHFCRFRIAF